MRLRYLLPVILVGGLLVPACLRGQSHPAKVRGANAKNSAGSPDFSPASQIAALQRAQNEAVASGDAVRITTTSQALLAHVLVLLAEVALVQGDPAQVQAVSTQALALDDSEVTRLRLASLLLRSGKPVSAVDIVRPATVAEPGNAIAWAILASSLRAAGEDSAAVDAYQHALKLDSSLSLAYGLASTYLALHQLAKAQELFKQIFAASHNDPIWYVAAGDALRDGRYLQEAIDAFKQALALDPKIAHGEFLLGLTYLQLNEWGPDSQSFEHLRKAAQQAPHEYVSNFYLGALESTDGTDLISSTRHLQIAATADPTQPEVWLYLGLNANRQHDMPEAERDLRRSIGLTGKDESRNNYQVRRAYFALGRLLIGKGEREEGSALLAKYKAAEQASVAASGSAISAKAALQSPGLQSAGHDVLPLPPAMGSSVAASAVAMPPLAGPQKHPELAGSEADLRHLLASGFNDLGTAQARQQHYASALTSFQKAESFEPPTPGLLRNLGIAAMKTADYSDAIRAFSGYFRADPSAVTADTRTRLMLASAEFSAGNFKAAAQDFGRVEEATLADPRAAYSWAFALAKSNRMGEANKLADGLAAKGLPIEQLSLVCNLYVLTEDYEGSLRCFRKAYTLDPNLPLAHYQAGQALVRLDRPLEAVPELRQELVLDPTNAEIQYSLAYALLQASQKQEAQSILVSLLEAHPNNSRAQYQLGKLLLEAGQPAQAVIHLEQSEQDDPQSDYVHYQLGTAYRRLNRMADAERQFTLFRQIKDRKRASATAVER